MSIPAKTAYFVRSAAHGMRHAPFIHLVAVITIAIALFTAGLSRGLVRVLDALVQSLGGEVELTVYLKDVATAEDARRLAAKLAKQTGGVAEVVPPDVALGRLAKELGDLGEALHNLPENPLPISVELEVPSDQRTLGGLRALADEIRKAEIVEAVDYGEEAVARLSAIAAVIKYAGLIGFAIVVIATIIIVSATLQLAIYSRREEIEVQKLVGATDRFVKAPFLIEGALQGLLGAAVALGALFAFSRAVAPELAKLFSFLLGSRPQPALVGGATVAELLIAGCVLGLLGSFIAVGRFLRV